jgi:hypothetical protein
MRHTEVGEGRLFASLLRVKKNARGAHNEKKGDEDSEIAWSTRRAVGVAERARTRAPLRHRAF